jgi:hypothetical protein
MALAEELLENDEADECSTLKQPMRIKWVTVVLPAGAWVGGCLLGLWAQVQGPTAWDNLEIRDAMRQPGYAYNTCATRGCRMALGDDEELCAKHAQVVDVPDQPVRADDPTHWPKVRARCR